MPLSLLLTTLLLQAPGSVAPALGDLTWSDATGDPAPTKRTVGSDGVVHEQGGARTLEAWHGRTVVLLALTKVDTSEDLQLIDLVARANADRRLVAAVLLAPSDEELSERAASLSVEIPVASAEKSPYLGGDTEAFVIGPTGELVWRGSPTGARKPFLEAVGVALSRDAAPALPRDLAPPLAKLQSAYFEGRWAEAGKGATKLAEKLERKDAEAAADARLLADKVLEHERDLRVRLSDSAARIGGDEALARARAAIARGFPRSDLAKEADEIAKEKRSAMGSAMGFQFAEAWTEELAERPVLFPEVKDSRGTRYAKKLRSMTRAMSLENDLTRRATALVDRYERD